MWLQNHNLIITGRIVSFALNSLSYCTPVIFTTDLNAISADFFFIYIYFMDYFCEFLFYDFGAFISFLGPILTQMMPHWTKSCIRIFHSFSSIIPFYRFTLTFIQIKFWKLFKINIYIFKYTYAYIYIHKCACVCVCVECIFSTGSKFWKFHLSQPKTSFKRVWEKLRITEQVKKMYFLEKP